MAEFPTAIPTFQDLVATQTLALNNHTARHNKLHAEIAAIAIKVGANSSTDPASHDYKISAHLANTSNPHNTTKAQVGLSNVENLSLVQILAAVYPVGSIYFNAGVSTNPATLLGFGTWVAWGAGRVPVGVDATQTEFDVVEETGGAKTHTLTTAEIPAHSHPAYHRNPDYDGVTTSGGAVAALDGVTYSFNQSTQNTGGGAAHNNLQPYITAYMWKRVS